MTGSTVVTTTVDGVATVALSRPEAMNALDTVTKVALLEALTEVAADRDVRAVVLTGSGRAFCVGQNLREHAAALAASSDPREVWGTVGEHYNPIVTLLTTMPKPVVAAVNGVAAGAGAAFALSCDFRVMARTASFNLAYAAIGLSADSGSTWLLPRLVGMAQAKELLLLPTTVDAERALQLGLATRVVDAEELAAVAAELAAQLAAGPTTAYGAIRAALAHSASHPLAESLDYEAEMMRLTGSTADHRGAVEAFLAKQPARFTGR